MKKKSLPTFATASLVKYCCMIAKQSLRLRAKAAQVKSVLLRTCALLLSKLHWWHDASFTTLDNSIGADFARA